MADAPSGAKITGAEIILLIILALGVFGYFFGSPIKPYQSAPTQTVGTNTTVTAQCGITLTSPKKLQKILTVVTVTGSITACNSNTSFLDQNDSVLATEIHVQIVDRTGAPVSDYVTIPIVASTNTSGTFSMDVPITNTPISGTGYAIVIGPTASDGTSLTARVPIIF